MADGDLGVPPANGGEFLIRLLQNPPHHLYNTPPPPSSQFHSHDPAVAAIGPTYSLPCPPAFQPNRLPPPWANNHFPHSPHQFAPHPFFPQNPNYGSDPGLDPTRSSFGGSVEKQQQHEEKGLFFGSFSGAERRNHVSESKEKMRLDSSRRLNGVEVGCRKNSGDFGRDEGRKQSASRVYGQERKGFNSWDGDRVRHGLNGYTEKSRYQVRMGEGEREREREREKARKFFPKTDNTTRVERWDDRVVSGQFEKPVSFVGSDSPSVSLSDVERSMMRLLNEEASNIRTTETARGDAHKNENDLDDLSLGNELDGKHEKKSGFRDKDYRSDKRGQSMLTQRMRCLKRQRVCRGDIDRLNVPLLAIYESLVPASEEKTKQKQLLTMLENIVSKEWPGSRLYLYGSCANSFGFSKSDIDVCLTIEDADINKSHVLLKLADLLQSKNLQNVQALTRARVPIVKLMDPTTGISCDICVNNELAVVNTKLLQDYAGIDVRLRQLAFLVKHWAKSRGVNETYQGTLSSYAYVLMCIHFLQLRRPAILPCLQEMNPTFLVTVDNVDCTYFDCVEDLVDFGAHNGESISQLLWAFFHYWAYFHDYTDDVISVRTGRTLSKRFKDWTRRIGNDRHLICIEDPFEVSHDLGRVVDKYSIRVLREEFERAAEIMQSDPNPCVTLFEPYIPA